MTRRFLYLDTETTGLDPVMNDIIEIGAIVEIDGEKKEEFKAVCQPFNYNTISSRALETNQHTLDMIKGYPSPKETFKEFIRFLSRFYDGKSFEDRYILVGQNVNFDKGFLKSFFFKNGYDTNSFNKLFNYQTVDLLGLSFLLREKGLIPNGKIKLEVLTKVYGIKQAKEHDALEDIRSTYEIFKIIGEHFLKDPSEIDLSKLDPETPLYSHLFNLRS